MRHRKQLVQRFLREPLLFAAVSSTVFADQAGGNRLLVNIEAAAVAMRLHGVLLCHCRRRQVVKYLPFALSPQEASLGCF